MPRLQARVAATILALLLTRDLRAQTPATGPADSLFDARVVNHAADNSTVELTSPDGTGRVTWAVAPQPEVRAQLATLGPGDRVVGTMRTNNGAKSVIQIAPLSVAMNLATRLAAFFGTVAVLLIFAQIVVPGGAKWLFIGEDNRYSNSKTQGALWFLTVISSYIAAITLRFIAGGVSFFGGVNVPSNLLLLSGISALTFVGAKQIVASRIDSNPRAAATVKPKSPFGPRFRDLVTDDSGTRGDFGDFQMLVITFIAVVVYGFTIYAWLGRLTLHASVQLPDVDSTLLGTFGLGQAAYLTKKMAGDTGKTAAPGPVTTDAPPKPSMMLPPRAPLR